MNLIPRNFTEHRTKAAVHQQSGYRTIFQEEIPPPSGQ